ncbi:MAG: ComEC/Rec2 family competence protein [Bacteroidales bacterium]|nr:ComEC/Rec2 family competence protein [Bacteroidales bacterium]
MKSGKVGIISNIDIVRRSPIFIPTMLYLFGILIGSRYHAEIKTLLRVLFLVIPIAFFIITRRYNRRGIHTDILLPVLLGFSLLLAGWLNVRTSGYLKQRSECSKIAGIEYLEASCKITGEIAEKERSIQAEVTLIEYNEKMLLYLDKKIGVGSVGIGDTLKCRIKPQKISNYPGSTFDYVRYMERKGIYCTSYVKAKDLIVKKLKKPTIRERIMLAKEWYIKSLTKDNDSQESGILVSLTIGDKSHINSETRDSFSKAGTMHLMAVSGLHVSFIYAFTSALFSFFGKGRKGRIIKLIMSSLFIWGYTALVGFSPSITRASVMATLFELSLITERDGSGLNSLSLSALIITLINPQSLFDLGFQLSFSAILSIIFIYPCLNNMMNNGKWLIKYVWTILSMSIACQIGTSLITIYNFQTIPIYFLLTNIIAIPLSGIILYIALIHAFAMGVGFHEYIVMKILLLLCRFLAWVMDRVESLPFSTIKCSLNNREAGILLFFLVAFFFYMPQFLQKNDT